MTIDASETRNAATPELKVPSAWSIALKVLLAPRTLWARMVYWGLDGDPGLWAIWPPRSQEQRDWIGRMSELFVCIVLATCTILLIVHGWQPRLLSLVLPGFFVALLIAGYVGIVFGVVVVGSAAIIALSATLLPARVIEVDTSAALASLCVGFSIRVGWIVAERVPYARQARTGGSRSNVDRWSLFVVLVSALTMLAVGTSALEKILLGGLLALGLFGGRIVSALIRRTSPLAFLSYHRGDPASKELAMRLHDAFPHSTFLDCRSIPSGSSWPDKIISALNRCTVLIAVITADEAAELEPGAAIGPETPRYWIHLERGFAERRGIPVVPVSMDADSPLPDQLKGRQGFLQINADGGYPGALIEDLERDHGLRRAEAPINSN